MTVAMTGDDTSLPLDAFDIDVSQDGNTVWVTAADGSCVGRFSRCFGMDVHRTVSEQLAGGKQCLHCTHAPAGEAEWREFCDLMLQHHNIPVQYGLLVW